MSEINGDSLPHLELKIENMLEKLIETDEELEKNGENAPIKFSDEVYESKYEKFFDKDFFINPSFQNEDNNKMNKINNFLRKSNLINLSQNNTNQNQNNQTNMNNIMYNNFRLTHPYNPKAPYQNNKIINSSSFFGPSNSNINSNSTTSLSSFYDNNIFNSNINSNINSSYIFTNNNINFKDNYSLMNYGYQEFNNSFNIENNNVFYDNKKVHNSYYVDNNNSNIIFKKNNIFNTNVGLEVLLIEVKKILNKIEKIDSTIYNKLKGKFEQIILTHKGSRMFQNYLKNTHNDILHQIFLELKNKLPKLLRDNYANYFCKKFFNCLNQKDRIEYLILIQNDLSSLSIDFTATYPIQGIIEILGSKAEKRIFYLGIKDSISVFCYNVYGTHILEKILSFFEEEFIREIIDYVYNNFISLSFNINGICLVKKLLLMTHKKELHKKIKKIIYDNAYNLVIHQYGNYVIQTIVENWDTNELEDIINQYKNKYVFLSMEKYSSNAIERIIEKNKNNLEIYINEICNDKNIIELIKNKYGNFVVQKAVKLSSGNNRDKIIGEISKNLNKLRDKKIINKWKAIISSKSFF